MTRDAAQAAEFSRPIAVEQIGPQETVRAIAANATERQRLAERFGLLALDRLEATVRLRRGGAGLILADGHFEADATQACVVTLEPVPARLALDFALTFGNSTVHGGAVVVGVDEEDPPEEIVNGRIDLGEAVAQQLAIALDPYPRSPAVQTPAEGVAGDGGSEPASTRPFAALSAWRRPQEK
jgi:uncharacterized metal-binding protein YceD (DUF177 family)